MKSKVACFTGHRPGKLNGYDATKNKDLLWELHDCIVHLITKEQVNHFINGLALGVDQWAAKVVIKLKKSYPHITLESAVPCKNHYTKWPTQAQEDWLYITENSDKVTYVSEEDFTYYCMQKRNEYMVDNSDIVISVWDGSRSGTKNCVDYAVENKKRIINLWKKEFRKI